MGCKVCDKPVNPKYFFCYHCYLLKQRGEIIKCFNCGKWRVKSKRYSHLCSDCSYFNDREKHPYKSFKQIYFKDENGGYRKISTKTNELREFHKKILKSSHRVNDSKMEGRKHYYHLINQRDKHSQDMMRSWADGCKY